MPRNKNEPGPASSKPVARGPAWPRSWAVPVTAWASLCLGLFWTVGLVLDMAMGLDRPLPLAAAAVLAAALPTVLPRLRRPGHLALSQDAPAWRVGLRFLVLCPVCWLGLTPLAWALARLLLATWPDPNHPQAGLFVLLVSLWLPLWWAPGCAALLVWRRYRAPSEQQETGPA